MKTSRPVLISLAVAVAVAGAAVFFWLNSGTPDSSDDRAGGSGSHGRGAGVAGNTTSPGSTSGAAGASGSTAALETRIASLEANVTALTKSLESLKRDFDGVSMEKASADRQALFAAEEGCLKADEYFEAGKYAIAGEGYLTFLKNHPNHPDAREIMKKARDAFLKAGYKDKGFWVQDEMMKSFPQNKAADMGELAGLEKDAGLYEKAAGHMAEAAELATNPEDRLWKRLYWAWYVQLAQGPAAGITALQQVQQEIASSGVANPKLSEHASRRLAEWQQQLPRQ